MKSPGKLLLVILVAALAVRVAVAWWWQSRLAQDFAFGDSETYWDLARTIARGEPYQYGEDHFGVFRTPGYPLLLSPIFLIAGDHASVLWGRALSAVLDTISVGGVGWLAWRLFDPRAGVLAAAMAALYPGSVAVGILVLSEAPFCPLMVLQLGLWIAAWRAASPCGAGVAPARSVQPGGPRHNSGLLWVNRRAAGLAALAGLAAGAATLMRPSWLLFTPFAVALGVAFSKARLRHLGLGVAMLAGLAMAMSPWWIRNARVTGHFVPTTLQVGASLYDGWNPSATGASEMSFVERFAAEERRKPDGDSLELRLDRRLRHEALAWARENPGRAAQLGLVKLVRMWNVWPNEPSMGNWLVRVAVAVTYVPIVLLAVLGAAWTARRGWPYVLCWLPAVYLSLLHMVFVSSIRYRQPAMLGLIVLAAGAAVMGAKRGQGSGDREQG